MTMIIPQADVSAHDIVRVARSWIGTRFQHQGRLKKTSAHAGGCDCLGLLVGIARELALPGMLEHDRVDYGHYPDSKLLCAALAEVMDEIPLSQLASGDIVVMTIDHEARHLGVISRYVDGGWGVIHAYAPAKRVVEHRLDAEWMKRLYTAFRLAVTS